MIIELMREGKTVGITSNSHEAIKTLLIEIEKQAVLQSFEFKGLHDVEIHVFMIDITSE